MPEPLKHRAQGRWQGILPTLGVSVKYLTGKHGPCPMCGGKDRFRFDNKDGFGTWICQHCSAGDGISLVMRLNGCDFKEAARRIEEVMGDIPAVQAKAGRSEREKREAMQALWSSSARVQTNDPVWQYLNRRTGLTSFPLCLRTRDRLRYHDDVPSFHWGMIAKVMGHDDVPATLHRTYLTADGHKAAVTDPRRLMNGDLPKGCAVRLAPYTDVLGIAEGIETAFSASKMFGVPCWAALNAGMLSSWIPPTDVKKIIVFGDNDLSFTGQEASYALARRLRSQEFDVRVEIPPDVDTDWNNVLENMEMAA